MPRTLLIDGDILAYQAGLRGEQATDWGDGVWTMHADLDVCIENMGETVCWYEDKLKATASVVALSDPTGDYFRKRILPTYKQNRAGARKPMVHKALVEHLHSAYKTYVKPGLEGDDVIGILATHPKLIKGEKVIVSIDKDFKGVPCKRAVLGEGGKWAIETVSEADADYFHLFQTLTGDTVDGYAGCPGVGPVKAERLLTPPEDVDEDGVPCWRWGAIVRAFEKAGLTEHEALVQARMARILRATDYNFKKRKPKLWHPPH